jgi:catechol 2,3-dioxygenase-like lactoylglutathione lyase family enzyme
VNCSHLFFQIAIFEKTARGDLAIVGAVPAIISPEEAMITRLSHATIYVLDQEEALKFYRDKLGFEVRNDAKMDNGFRWITVGPKTQPDLEIILMAVKESPMFPAEQVDALKKLIRSGAMGVGVLYVDDCQKTYQELKAKGVEFLTEPTDNFYGMEALMRDNSGNWFSMTQPKKWK